jgi:bile acid:Na+ symporter, BASS family
LPLSLVLSALAFLGRYGTQGFALSIFMGLALPQFAAAARPLLPVTIFLFVAMTFARADLSAMKAALRSPKAVIIAVVWLSIAPILMMLAIFAVFPKASLDPGLVLGLVVIAASPPIMSGPAVAMMLNIEPTVLIAATIITTTAAPFLGPPIAELLLGGPAPIDTQVLMLRLLGLIGGAIILALIVRKLIGYERIVAHKVSLDGFGVVMYFLFAIAAMDGVTDAFMTRPAKVFLFLGIAFAVVLAGFAFAWMALRLLMKPADVFLMGYGTAQRNMGAMIAALGAATPETTFLFFALAQFPIYMMPQLLKPIAKRFAVPPSPLAGEG